MEGSDWRCEACDERVAVGTFETTETREPDSSRRFSPKYSRASLVRYLKTVDSGSVSGVTSCLEEEADGAPGSWEHRLGLVWLILRQVGTDVDYEDSGRAVRTPTETLETYQAGDCCDQSVLLASLLVAAGETVRLVAATPRDPGAGHLMVQLGVASDRIAAFERTLMALAPWPTPLGWEGSAQDDLGWLLLDPTVSASIYYSDCTKFYSIKDGALSWNAGQCVQHIAVE